MNQVVQTQAAKTDAQRIADARRYLASAAVSHVSLTVRRAREQKTLVRS